MGFERKKQNSNYYRLNTIIVRLSCTDDLTFVKLRLMNIKLLIIFLLFVLCISCGKIIDVFSKDLDTEYRTDVKSKFNHDNKILIEGKEYLYKVVQKDKNRILNFDLILDRKSTRL